MPSYFSRSAPTKVPQKYLTKFTTIVCLKKTTETFWNMSDFLVRIKFICLQAVMNRTYTYHVRWMAFRLHTNDIEIEILYLLGTISIRLLQQRCLNCTITWYLCCGCRPRNLFDIFCKSVFGKNEFRKKALVSYKALHIDESVVIFIARNSFDECKTTEPNPIPNVIRKS